VIALDPQGDRARETERTNMAKGQIKKAKTNKPKLTATEKAKKKEKKKAGKG
jgi:hypothetical protein